MEDTQPGVRSPILLSNVREHDTKTMMPKSGNGSHRLHCVEDPTSDVRTCLTPCGRPNLPAVDFHQTPDAQSSTLSNHPNCPAWTLGNPPDDSPRSLGQCFNDIDSPHTMSETSQVTDDPCHPMQHRTMTKPCRETSIEAPRDLPRSLGGTIDYIHPVYTVSETHHVLNLAMPKPLSPCNAGLKPSQQDTIPALGNAKCRQKPPRMHGSSMQPWMPSWQSSWWTYQQC